MNWLRILKKLPLIVICIVGWGILAWQLLLSVFFLPMTLRLGIHVVVPLGLTEPRFWPVQTLLQFAYITCSAIAVQRLLCRIGLTWRRQLLIALPAYPLIVGSSNVLFTVAIWASAGY